LILRRILGLPIKLVVSLLLVAFLVYRYGGDAEFRDTIAHIDPKAFLLAEGILALGLVLLALRWKVLLEAAGATLPLPTAIRLVFVGYFFNFFLPTTVGGDVARVLGAGSRAPLAVVGGSVLVERLLGFGCLLTIGIVASFGVPALVITRNALWVSAAVFVAGTLVLLFAPLPRARGEGLVARALGGLGRLALQVRAYGFRPAALGAALVLSFAWQLALVLVNVALSAGLGGIAPLSSLLALVPAVQAITMIPVSVGGLGVRELGYEYFFRTSGFDPSGAVALAAAFLAATIVLALVGGIAYAVGRGERT
jgi:hypothetical protein